MSALPPSCRSNKQRIAAASSPRQQLIIKRHKPVLSVNSWV